MKYHTSFVFLEERTKKHKFIDNYINKEIKNRVLRGYTTVLHILKKLLY